MLNKHHIFRWKYIFAAGFVLLVLLMAGCANENESAKDGANSGAVDQSVKDGKRSEPMQIKWMNVPEIVVRDTYPERYIEGNFNVQIEMYPIAWGDFVQKQQLILGGGDIPDIMYIRDPAALRKFASQGMLMELPVDTVAQYAPTLKKTIDEFAPKGWIFSDYQGKNYGFPTWNYSRQFIQQSSWRTDLLRKAGIDTVPDTIEQYAEAFEALRKIGVYGMSTDGTKSYEAFHTIFGAFGVMPGQWMEKDGKVVNGAVQPEAKAALALLADWYAKGYIDPEFITGKDLGSKYVAGKYAYLDTTYPLDADASDPASQLSAILKTNPEGEITLSRSPEGPGGRGAWAWGTAENIFAFGRHMADQPEKVKKILDIFEQTLFKEQYFLNLGWGEQGKHWEFNDPAKGIEGGMKRLPPYDVRKERENAGFSSPEGITNIFTGQIGPELVGKYWNKKLLNLYQANNDPMFDLLGKPDALPSSGKYWEELMKLKVETYAAIVRGDKPVDAFDDFVKKWNASGGSQLEEEANQLYDQFK